MNTSILLDEDLSNVCRLSAICNSTKESAIAASDSFERHRFDKTSIGSLLTVAVHSACIYDGFGSDQHLSSDAWLALTAIWPGWQIHCSSVPLLFRCQLRDWDVLECHLVTG